MKELEEHLWCIANMETVLPMVFIMQKCKMKNTFLTLCSDSCLSLFKSVNRILHCTSLCMRAKMTFCGLVQRHIEWDGLRKVKIDGNSFVLFCFLPAKHILLQGSKIRPPNPFATSNILLLFVPQIKIPYQISFPRSV